MTSPTTPPPPTDPAAPGQGQQAPPSAATPGWQPGWQPAYRRHDHSRDERRGAVIGGVILILLGLAFLAQEFVPDLDLGRLWPVILVVIGGALVVSSFRRGA